MHGKQILITGITGFIGGHLATFLKHCYPSCKVTGIGRRPPTVRQDYSFYVVDLISQEDIVEILLEVKPDYIFHLAGLVFSYEWSDLYSGNVIATQNLLEAIKKSSVNAHVVIAGSAAEYGLVPPEHLPVNETYLTLPSSPYAMTKLWQTLMGKYHNTHNAPVTIGRIFNVIGYGAASQLSTGDFFSQLNNIAQEKQQPRLVVGNLQIKRDFLDVNDVCTGLIALAMQGQPGEIYNICSGKSVSYNDILHLAISITGVNIEIIIDQKKSQNSYIVNSYGCNEKIKRDVNWKPVVTLDQSVRKALKTSICNYTECVAG